MAKIDPQVNINSISRISSGTLFKGEMFSPADIRIDGGFEGRLYTDGKVVVGETAKVDGEVICSNVDIWGKLSGDLVIKDVTSLKAGCDVNANLKVRKLIVELGATFNGTCKMISEADYEQVAKDRRPGKQPGAEKQPASVKGASEPSKAAGAAGAPAGAPASAVHSAAKK